MRIMMIGPVSSGKTTLCRYFADLPLAGEKTQTVELVGGAIDTPGEYLENHRFLNRLVVTSAGADMVFFLQDCTMTELYFSPGQASLFAGPVPGIITKTDLARAGDIERAREFLKLAGASPLFAISVFSGAGMEPLNDFLRKSGLDTAKRHGGNTA
jgi:ethanolamine utilization protein EutP